MAHKGKTQLLITFVVASDKVAEVDRLAASHGAWMAEGHHREGPKALLSYNFSKGPELENPLDPSSASTGNTRYVLNEIYESPAGIEDHWRQAQESWGDFSAFVAIIGASQSPNPARWCDKPVALVRAAELRGADDAHERVLGQVPTTLAFQQRACPPQA